MAIAARLIAAFTLLMTSGLARAQERPDGPFEWQMDFQNPATLVMEYIHWFSWYTLIIITLITILVVALIGWCAWRFNERSNPVPSRVTHNTLIEVLWTVIPVFVLVAIAIPSFKLLYGQYDPSRLYADFDPETPFLTVKFTGVQWAWDVSYANDEENAGMGVAEPISIYMLPVDQLTNPDKRFEDLAVGASAVDHVDVYFNAGHPGVETPHAHVVLWHVPAADEARVAE